MPPRLRTGAPVALLVTALASPAYSAPSEATTQAASGATAIAPELPPDVINASFAPGSTWTPEKAVYGTTSTDDVPVAMCDGTVLRANVIYPTDPVTGTIANGPFPVILSQTPYGKGKGGLECIW